MYMVLGSVKGLTSHQLEELDCHVILGNTYHLENRPTSELVAKLGGLHSFVSWKRGMLTDSGGFQVRSSSRVMAEKLPWAVMGSVDDLNTLPFILHTRLALHDTRPNARYRLCLS